MATTMNITPQGRWGKERDAGRARVLSGCIHRETGKVTLVRVSVGNLIVTLDHDEVAEIIAFVQSRTGDPD
jgi:hypothetical protein